MCVSWVVIIPPWKANEKSLAQIKSLQKDDDDDTIIICKHTKIAAAIGFGCIRFDSCHLHSEILNFILPK